MSLKKKGIRFLLILTFLAACESCTALFSPSSSNDQFIASKASASIPVMELDRFEIDSNLFPNNKFQFQDHQLIWTEGDIRLILDKRPGSPFETYQIKNSRGKWKKILQSQTGLLGCEKIVFTSGEHQQATEIPDFQYINIETNPAKPTVLSLNHESPKFSLVKKITPNSEKKQFSISVELTSHSSLKVHSLESLYFFSPATVHSPPDFVWTPCLRPDRGDVIADHCFRSPAIILQKKEDICSLIPNLEFLQTKLRMPTVLDLDCTHENNPRVSFGLCHWNPRGHVYYKRNQEASYDGLDNKLSYGLFIQIETDTLPKMGFKNTVRTFWNHYGNPSFEKCSFYTKKSLKEMEREYFEKSIPEAFIPVDIPGVQGGLVKSNRAKGTNGKTNNDAWFSAWFQSMRSAYGMLLESNRENNRSLKSKALSLVDLLLCAPQEQGLFPSIFCLSEDQCSGDWQYDSRWAGHHDCYHALDCAWTGYWLLRIAEVESRYTDKILAFLKPLAEFLMRNQLSTGAIPSFYDSITLKARDDLIGLYPAETSGPALFLAKYYSFAQDRAILQCACKAMSFMAQQVFPTHRWFDFENFLSSSRKPYDFHDPFTLQFPQSTLCMIFSCHAFMELYKTTGDKRFEQWGSLVLDYLSLYQQIWSPPFLSPDLFGGFGVQNTDSEWSDARGSLMAELYFDYFKETGCKEYLERGAAALHSVFAISPDLSWGRFGKDISGGMQPCIHWGTGSAVISAVILRNKFGDILIDLENELSFSLDDCVIQNLNLEKHSIDFDLYSSHENETHYKAVFLNCSYGVYSIKMNNKDLGTFSASELRKGIYIKSERD